MNADRRKHPSGKPLNAEPPRGHLPVPRVPYDEPLTPGLRPGRAKTEAIGFRLPRRTDDE